jgi:hypothetical protein
VWTGYQRFPRADPAEVAGREQPRRRGGDPTLVMSRPGEGSTFLLRLPAV